MSIASEISRLQVAKASIKDAIEAKGVTVLSSAKLDEYPNYISQISGGESRFVVPNGMCFGYSRFSALPQVLQDADWSNVTNTFSMFYNCSSLTAVAVSWPNVGSMNSCFLSCSQLASISIDSLSSVSSMYTCFASCVRLVSLTLPLNAFSNVSNLSGCFRGCQYLTELSLSHLGKVTIMSACFSACMRLKKLTLSGLSVVNTLSGCFMQCSALEDLVVDSWGTVITNLTNWGMSYCTKLTHQSLINLISALYTTNVSRNCTIGTTNLAKLTAEEKAVATAKGWNLN